MKKLAEIWGKGEMTLLFSLVFFAKFRSSTVLSSTPLFERRLRVASRSSRYRHTGATARLQIVEKVPQVLHGVASWEWMENPGRVAAVPDETHYHDCRNEVLQRLLAARSLKSSCLLTR